MKTKFEVELKAVLELHSEKHAKAVLAQGKGTIFFNGRVQDVTEVDYLRLFSDRKRISESYGISLRQIEKAELLHYGIVFN